MTKRKLTAEDIKELKVVVAERSFMGLRVRQIGDLIHDLEAAEAEIERLRVDNRCERHGGYLDEDFCYPCHTENLIKAEAEVERCKEAMRRLIDAGNPEKSNRAFCNAMDILNPLPEGEGDFHNDQA